MAYHVEHGNNVVEGVAHQEASELCWFRIKVGSENHVFFSFALIPILKQKQKLEFDADLSLVTRAHVCRAL